MKKFIRTAVITMATAAMLASTGCASKGAFKDGTYEGVSTKGMHGELKVEVKVTSGKISAVSVTSHKETEGIGTAAIDQIPAKIIEKQSTEVDAISGATITSVAILEAVAGALEKAK